MKAIITVSKSALNDKPELMKTIEVMSEDIFELAEAFAFSPKAGYLYELLNYLNKNNLNYHTDFSDQGER